jgi:hypothetical protein
MHQLIVNRVAYIVQMDPGLEIVLFSPDDLPNYKLKENSPSGASNVPLFDMIDPSITVTCMIVGRSALRMG